MALTDIRAKSALVFCLMIPMMIPPQITALAWMQVTGPSSVLLKTLGLAPPLGSPQSLHSAWGIAVLLGIQHAAIVFLTLRAGLRMIPGDLVEAARISGARGARVWAQIVLPLSLPSLAAGAAMTFVTALGNFGIPAMLGIPARYSTLPTLIYQRLAGMGQAVLPEVAVLALLIGTVAVLGVLAGRLMLRHPAYGLVGLSVALSGRHAAPVQAAIGQLDPAMEEAAASAGAHLGRRLRTIVLPLAAPAAGGGGDPRVPDRSERADGFGAALGGRH